MECNIFIGEVQVPVATGSIEAPSLFEALKQVKDQRGRRGRRYPAGVVLTLVVLAKLAGETSVQGIAEWVQLRKQWVTQRLPLRNGQVPCANTYRHVCNHTDVGALNAVLGAYFARLHGDAQAQCAKPAAQAAAAPKQRGVRHLALDGKSLRGTRRRGASAKAVVQTVGLYNVTKAYMWQQQAVLGKGQERKAARTLLEPLTLRGSVVSADALHTQPKWAQAVLDRGGDYLLIAKRNQADLREAIALLFSQPLRPRLFPEGAAHSVDKAHGRYEVRRLRVSRALRTYLAPHWPQVAQVFRLERTITRQGHTTYEVAYGLTSLPSQHASPAQLLRFVRHHWHIENRCHWRRDVTLGEDACRVADGQAPQVLAALNNAVLAFVDFSKQPNLATATRYFDAFPDKALDLLLRPQSTPDPLAFV